MTVLPVFDLSVTPADFNSIVKAFIVHFTIFYTVTMPLPYKMATATASGGSKNFEKGTRKTIYQIISPVVIYRECTLRTIYAFYTEKAAFLKKFCANREGGL